ncbi:hypothetical protein Scep_008054 [Stephania cephalantha]|uniref:Major facilitator superfamily (MFS) profile domain-containing protein n=1 Tax=Stephania cephalantha TaxID=152367 RepID=A0AAP0KDN6_9MAGN
MAGGAFVDPETAKRAQHYEYNITRAFILSCMIGAIGGSLFGYDLGVSGGVTSMDDFLVRFFPKVYKRKLAYKNETDYCKYDNQVLTLFTSSLYFAGLVSTFAASYLTRQKGRKASIICGSISFLLGAIVNAAAQNIAMLIIGRILLGVGIGFGNQAVPLYLSETAPPKIRGAVNQLFQLTTCLGIMVANLVNYFTEKLHPWGWRLSLGLAAVPAILMFIGGVFLPETPNSLVEQGRMEEGRRNLERIRGTKNVDAEFADLIDASNAARAVKHPFRNLLERRNRPQLVIGALGIPHSSSSRHELHTLLCASDLPKLGIWYWSISIFISHNQFNPCPCHTCVNVPRRQIGKTVVVVIILALKFGHGVVLAKGYAVTLVIAICTFVAAYGWSWGPLGWLVPSELFPLEMRSAGRVWWSV